MWPNFLPDVSGTDSPIELARSYSLYSLGCLGDKKKKKNPSRVHYGFSTAILGLLRVWVTGVAHNTIML